MILRSFFLAAAVLQLGIAVLNLFLVPVLKWQDDLARAPLLLREVFQVHAWFISVTLAIFGAMTLRFADAMALGGNAVAHWLAGCIGMFWALRAVLQATYYSSSHWRGQPKRTLIHIALLVLYGGFAVVYCLAAFGGYK
jgi:hypothetical protein